MTDFWQRLKQRKLVQWAVAYLAASWGLLQILDLAGDNYGWPTLVVRLAFGVIALGFVVTLVLAWYHGERGVQKASGIELLVLALLFAIGGGLLWRYANHAAPEDVSVAQKTSGQVVPAPATPTAAKVDPKSIAVLPFSSMSADKDDAYFADGLSEEIINSLSRVPDLQVSARTSSFAFRNSDKTVPQIAADLAVASVLEGSVRRSGDHLRMTAQLIRAADGFELWSETYDRDSMDIIVIQEDVARSIATALKTVTDPEALAAMQRAGTRSVPAYQAYLQGLALLSGDAAKQGDRSVQADAQAAFDRAITLDPQFVDAYVSSANLQMLGLQPTAMGSPEADDTYVERLTRLRKDLDHASGLARTVADKNFYGALRASVDQQYITAIRLMSDYVSQYPGNSAALGHLARWTLMVGDYPGAHAWLEKMTQTKLDRGIPIGPVSGMVWVGDYTRAAELARQQLRTDPENLQMAYQVHRALLSAGDIDAAARLLPRIMASKIPKGSKSLVQIRQACAEGRADDAGRLYARGVANDGPTPTSRWLELLILGRDDEAARLLEHLDTPAYFNALSAYLAYPQFDVTRYPKLQAILTAQGIHRAPAIGMPYFCKQESAQ